MSYSIFSDQVLLAVYEYSARSEGKPASLKGVSIDRGIDAPSHYLDNLRREWSDRSLADFLDDFDDPENSYAELTAVGLREAERLIVESLPLKANAPASDRIVKFDHNRPEYSQILTGIADIREAVRGDNSAAVDDSVRDRVSKSLSAAETLWQASELKVIQIKIGVLMAISDASTLLAPTAKGVAAALLVDTVKAFIKSHSGIDLDNI